MDTLVPEHQQRGKKLLYKQALDASYSGIVITDATDPAMPVIYVNKAFERITGYLATEALGQNCRFLQGKYRDENSANRIRTSIAAKRECHITLRNARKDGSLFWNKLYLSPVYDDSGFLTHYIGVLHDITEQKQFEEMQAYQANHDLLTGLPNRTLLQDRLTQWCQLSRRHQRNLAVLLIDLDGFKLVNDSLGHQLGDRLLIEVATRLKAQVRPGDTVARVGSDEFVILLTDLQHKEDVTFVAGRLLETIDTVYLLDKHEVHLTASIGLTKSDGYLDDPMVLLQQADLAMLRAKQYGYNNFQWFDAGFNYQVTRTLTMRGRLQKALAAQEFVLYYQPQIDVSTGQISCIEALLRWPQPEGASTLSPTEFIPVAEESGQIIPLSEWVFEQAASQVKHWHLQGISDLKVAVNVSATHFKRLNFIDSVRQILQRVGLDPKYFELELTENILFDNSESAIEKLTALKKLGVTIAIDDFGTGFSSLNYLKRLPIDKIKIDRSFIRDIIIDQHDAGISLAIISIAKILGLKVIAEGVETAEQVAFLSKNRCDELQGYYYSKPMSAAALCAFIHQHKLTHSSTFITQRSTNLLLDDENSSQALVQTSTVCD